MMRLMRRVLLKAAVAIVVILGISWVLLDYFIPAPPSKITMATGPQGTGLNYFGRRYRQRFAQAGIDLDLRETGGTVENFRLVNDPNSGVQIALDTTVISERSQAAELSSLGLTYNAPCWIFYSAAHSLDDLPQLKGKRIAVGAEGSGAQYLAERVLGKANINSSKATLLPLGGSAAVDALNEGKVDVVFIVGAPDAPAIAALLKNPRFRLMDFPNAEAFTRIFPDVLVRLVLPKGVVEMDPPNPPTDVTLLANRTRVLIRNDVHPAIVQLLARTLKEEHGAPGIFNRTGEFPTSIDPEYPVSQIAIDYYKNGPSFLEGYLPFWMTIYARRMIALLVTALAIAVPVFSFAPRLYGWFVQEYLRKLYRRLRLVEKALHKGLSVHQFDALQKELADIERATASVPMRNSDLYFILRYHLDRTRSRLTGANQPGKADPSVTS